MLNSCGTLCNSSIARRYVRVCCVIPVKCRVLFRMKVQYLSAGLRRQNVQTLASDQHPTTLVRDIRRSNCTCTAAEQREALSESLLSCAWLRPPATCWACNAVKLTPQQEQQQP